MKDCLEYLYLPKLVGLLAHQFQIDWWGHDGIAQWARVRANGLMLAGQTGANRHVVEMFLFFHDSRRFNEHMEDGHGAHGRAVASRLEGRYFDATDGAGC